MKQQKRRGYLRTKYFCPKCKFDCTNKSHIQYLKSTVNGYFDEFDNKTIFRLTDIGELKFKNQFGI